MVKALRGSGLREQEADKSQIIETSFSVFKGVGVRKGLGFPPAGPRGTPVLP